VTYIRALADAIRRELPDDASTGDDELMLLYALVCLTKREEVSNEDVHNAWSTWMTLRDAEHEALVPYAALPPEVRAEDSPFTAAIRQVAAGLE